MTVTIGAPLADSVVTKPERRLAGRPHGAKGPVVASHQVLRHTHFAYVRYALEGFALRDAWLRCLAFAGGIDDERYRQRLLRQICAQIRLGARARGLQDYVRMALQAFPVRRQGRALRSTPDNARAVAAELMIASARAPALPTLGAWVQQRCTELGIDDDFQSQAEWLDEYQREFDLDLDLASRDDAETPPVRAANFDLEETEDTSSPGDVVNAVSRPALAEQLLALNRLMTELAAPPALADDLQAWLAPALCARLRPAGIVTMADLADYVDVYGFRWHARVRGLGAVRAARLVDWLAPLADALARPLRDMALRAPHRAALAREWLVAGLDPVRLQRFGIVPLERLAVPPELSGRHGSFRLAGANTFGADDDLGAIQAWLQRYARSPRTYRAYFHAVEAFYLWCLWVRCKALSSLVEADLHAFRDFVAAPPADWVQPSRVDRGSAQWRPFRGPLSPASQRHLFTVLGSLYSGLVDAGYLSVHAVSGVKPHLKLGRSSLNIRRSFSEAQWSWLMATLRGLPDTAHSRRLQLVLALGSTTGLRLIELCTARMENLRSELVEGQAVWLLQVVGKGRREREVVVFDDVKAMIDRHQVDMVLAGIGFDARAPLRSLAPDVPPHANTVRQLVDGQQAASTAGAGAVPEGDKRPVIGALRPPVPRWGLDTNGVAVLDKTPPQADAYGAIDPSALHQALKRLFARVADGAALAEPPVEAAVFRKASTHWLRHFFANNAVDDGVTLTVLRDGLGHADISTTSVYLRAEQRALVAEMSKMRRRG